MNNYIIDNREPFVYVKFDRIVEYIEELIDYDLEGHDYQKQLLDYMKGRFSRAFLVVEHDSTGGSWEGKAEIAAGRQFYDYLRATSDKYIKLIQFQEYKLNDLLELKKEIDRIGEKDSFRTNIENPTEDSTLRKFNETPLSGNNPNLLDDTYLSESERHTIIAGQRESESTDTGNDFSSEIIIDDIERLSAIPVIRENIRNYYSEWISDIDRELFTYIPLDF